MRWAALFITGLGACTLQPAEDPSILDGHSSSDESFSSDEDPEDDEPEHERLPPREFRDAGSESADAGGDEEGVDDARRVVLRLEAEEFDGHEGLSTQACTEGGLNVNDIGNGEWLRFDDVGLDGVGSVRMRVASANHAAEFELRRDSPAGELVATCLPPFSGGWQSWTTVTCDVTSGGGEGSLYLVAVGPDDLANGVNNSQLPNLNWLELVSGKAPPHLERLRLEGERHDGNLGLGLEAASEGGQNLMGANDGEWVAFDGIDFERLARFEARVASDANPALLEFRKGSPTGELLGSCVAPFTGGWQRWLTVSCEAELSAGEGTLYVVLDGAADLLPNLDWFELVYE
jgi:arabinoxylan arabinofuranohydrolase